MTAMEIVELLRSLGNESIKRTLMKHGAQEPFFGVKIEDLQKLRDRGAIGKKRKSAKC